MKNMRKERKLLIFHIPIIIKKLIYRVDEFYLVSFNEVFFFFILMEEVNQS
jgi:hypothetical protein